MRIVVSSSRQRFCLYIHLDSIIGPNNIFHCKHEVSHHSSWESIYFSSSGVEGEDIIRVPVSGASKGNVRVIALRSEDPFSTAFEIHTYQTISNYFQLFGGTPQEAMGDGHIPRKQRVSPYWHHPGPQGVPRAIVSPHQWTPLRSRGGVLDVQALEYCGGR